MKKSRFHSLFIYLLSILIVLTTMYLVWRYFGQRIRVIEEGREPIKTTTP